WHITSTCGIFGAAMGIGALTGLSEDQLVWALGNASAQAGGLVETLGTMSKSISVGNAARNGLVSALIAAKDFSGPAAPLDGPRGFIPVFSDTPNQNALFDGLGDIWEIGKNTYKPYPVGVVLNPVVEACLEMSQDEAVVVEDIAGVTLTGHPLLRQRTDRPNVTTGRESQVSAQHAIAIVLRRGRAGLPEFNDEAVVETKQDGIRPDIKFIDDESYDIDAVEMVIHTSQGGSHASKIVAAQGGPRNPMSDEALENKLSNLAIYGGFKRDVGPLSEAIWTLDTAPDAAAIMELAANPA
ncbi:MAG: MmgE/PrpD family protein, partial [Rhodospirillaceae bacterium]|nr:MmgE/PrpD family protein [Rhodospirillaceae bacterium]